MKTDVELFREFFNEMRVPFNDWTNDVRGRVYIILTTVSDNFLFDRITGEFISIRSSSSLEKERRPIGSPPIKSSSSIPVVDGSSIQTKQIVDLRKKDNQDKISGKK